MNKIGFILLALVNLFALAIPAGASGEIFNSFPYDPSNGSIIAGDSSLLGYLEVAAAFTPTQDYLLTDADLPLYSILGGNGPVTVTVYADASGLPGTVLDSATVTTLDGADPVYNFVFTAHPTLATGQQYWISAVASGDALDGWANSLTDTEPTSYRSGPAQPWYTPNPSSPALRVSGIPAAPEPSGLMTLGLGAGVLLVLPAWRRKRSDP